MPKRESLSWTLKSHEIDAFEVLKDRLGFKDAEFCDFANFNTSSFSQIRSGKRNFNLPLRQKLDAFVSQKLAERSVVSGEEHKEISASIDSLLRRGADNGLENHSYQPPGTVLTVGAPNYIARHSDDMIARTLSSQSMIKGAYVVGGVGTGKTSLMKRIPAIALKRNRRVIMGRALDYFVDGSWPAEKLSKSDIWNACGYALADGHEDFKTNNMDSTKRSFNRDFRRLLNRHLKKKPGAVRVIEDFNEVSIRARYLEDVSDLLYTLFAPSERSDDNLIFIADDGLAGSTQGISEFVTRGAFIECAHIDDICLEELIDQVLTAHPARQLIQNTQHAIEEMRDAFGCCLFLHHAVLHKIREIPLEQLGHYASVSALNQMIDVVLGELGTVRDANSVAVETERNLQQFAVSVLQRLKRLENSHRISEDLADGVLGGDASYDVIRFLEWSGYVDRGGGVPDFVQQICRRMQQ